MPNHTVTETDMPPKRRFFRRPWIMFATVAAAGLAVLAITYAVQYFSARANLDAAIAEARANGEPVWFSDVNPGAERNPSKDAREWLALLSEIDIWEVNDPLETKVESLLHPDRVEGEVKFTPNEHKRFARYSEANARVLKEMTLFARRGECWFEYDYDTVVTSAILLPHIDELRVVYRAATADILSSMSTGDPDTVDDAIKQFLALADNLKNEPFLVSQLIRIRRIDLGLTLIEQVSRHGTFNRPESEDLAELLLDIESTLRLSPTVLSERAVAMTTLNHLDERDNEVMLAYSLAGAPGWPVDNPKQNWFEEILDRTPQERTVSRWNSVLHLPQLLNQQTHLLTLMRELAQLIDVPGPAATKQVAALEQSISDQRAAMPILPHLIPGLTSPRGRTMAVRQRLINAALLLKFASQHGNSPPDERALAIKTAIDTAPAGYFSGKPLKFKVEDSAISVYDINPEDGNPVGQFTLTISSKDAAQADTGNSTSSEEGAP